jgi:hypothetical protein
MMLFIVFGFLLNLQTHANLAENAKVLSALGLPASNVYMRSYNDIRPGDRSNVGYDFILEITKETTFRGAKLPKGTIIYFKRDKGLMSVINHSKVTIKFENVPCNGEIMFLENRLCSCQLTEPYEVAKGIVLPIGSTVVFKLGKLQWFTVNPGHVYELDKKGRRKVLDEPVMVGGTEMKGEKVYVLKDGKLVSYGGAPDLNFYCGNGEDPDSELSSDQ